MTRPFVVTLVHGTFARGAPWTTDEDAVIRTRLRQAFPGQVTFRAFTWSGRNSHGERIRAGAALAEDQAAVAASRPDLPRFVIAHSHGGNVALYSMRDSAPEAAPAGVITMGTPFITCEPRDLAASTPLLRLALPFAAMMVTLVVAGTLWALTFNALRLGSSETARMIIAGLGVLFIPSGSIQLAVLVHRRFPRMAAWAAQRQRQIIGRLQLPKSRVPKLCIHVAGDEAGAWLRIARMVADAPFLAWRKTTVLVLFLAGVALSFYAHRNGIEGSGPIQTLTVSIAVSVILAALGILSYAVYWQFFMAGFPMLIRSHGLAFGGESVLDNWLVRIATDRLPEASGGSVTERAYAVPARAKGLRHSWMYSEAEVADEMASWIRLRLSERPARERRARVEGT